MQRFKGSQAVRQHADEAGLTEGISAIVRAFGKDSIKDIQIETKGKTSFIHEYQRDADRICVPAITDESLADVLKTAREKKR